MTKKSFAYFAVFSCLLCSSGNQSYNAAQDDPMHLRVNVVLVQLNVAVTNDKGEYVTGLRPEDFSVTEDKIPQKISTFEENSESGHSAMEATRRDQKSQPDGPGKTTDPDPTGLRAASGDVAISHGSEDNLF